MSGSGATSLWWSSDEVAPSDRTEAWGAALSESYRLWRPRNRVAPDFSARLRRSDLAGAELVECLCGPCDGRRDLGQIRQDDRRYLGIQIVLSGRERFRVGDDTISVGVGDALVWASDRQAEFEVLERLHKVTLMLPLDWIADRLPRGGGGVRCGLMDGRRGLGALLFGQLNVLRNEAERFDAAQAATAKRVLLDLAAACMFDAARPAGPGLADLYLRNVQAYLLDHLHDEDLTLADAARACRISLRYLHMLFERTGSSASSWIQEQRLQRCRDELDDGAFDGLQLSEIGWRWGFRDASQFSRAFRARFGESPSAWRASRPSREPGRAGVIVRPS